MTDPMSTEANLAILRIKLTEQRARPCGRLLTG